MRNRKIISYLEKAVMLLFLIALSILLTAGKGAATETILTETPAEEAPLPEINAEETTLPEAPAEEMISTADLSSFREEDAVRLTEGMSLEQRVAQMIMPAIRTWGSERKSVQELSAFPALAEALRRHQYGGVILFGSNIANTAQTVRLISDLQANNAQGRDPGTAEAIPYLVAADQEGGSVARLTMGTRGTGSMAIGATGDEAAQSALSTGRMFGEELAALGINVNLGPCVDVITDLTDMGMSTRVFSNDPYQAAELGMAFMNGVSESGVVTTYKHFPGVGDGSDYPTSVQLTREELEKTGLLAFRMAVDNGAEMVMTSATTFPLIDDEVLMADGVTKGYYPATLSPGFVTEMLRKDLAFDGVVMTDALEMEQFVTEPDNGKEFFSGEWGSVEHDLQVAERAINAGCDILLIPTDLNGDEAAQYYDDYIAGIVGLIEDGAISEERVNEAVRRILELKIRHGLFDMDASGVDTEQLIEAAENTVGSSDHHAIEADIAAKAVTLLKNDHVLPLSGNGKRIVILGRTSNDNTPVSHALDRLMNDGFIDSEAWIENRISGENRGHENAATSIVIDHYYQGGALSYSDELTAAIQDADVVVCLCAVGAGIESLQDDSVTMQGVSRALSDAHAAGKKFVLLSDNLPVDAARFQDADAIVCAYLSAGFGIDPTARTSGSENVGAFNANVPAALYAIFGAADTPGRLPIDIPILEQNVDGSWAYGDTILYERGSHNSVEAEDEPEPTDNPSGGCYVATSIYGSYDCPEVWTLRRFRDDVLAETWYGRLFVRTYYTVSPVAVKLFGDSEWFRSFFQARLDKMVSDLQRDGFSSAPYRDLAW